MLTRCPSCGAWFRVRAEHLSVANGFVTCGACEHVFNALASLVEEAVAPTPVRLAPESTPGGTSLPSAASTPAAARGALAAASDSPAADVPSPPAAYSEPAGAAAPAVSPAVPASSAPADGPAVPPMPAAAAPAPPPSMAESSAVATEEPVAPAATDVPSPAAAAEAPPARAEAVTAEPPLPPLPASGPFPPADSTPPGSAPGTPADGPVQPAAAAAGDTPGGAEDAALEAAPPRTATLSDAEHAILFTAPGSAEDDDDDGDPMAAPAPDVEDRTEPPDPGPAAAEPAVPDLLRAELAALERAKRPRRRRWPWAASVGVLAVVLAAQGAFLARATITSALPATASWFAQACAWLGCRGPAAARPANSVQLAARDVREHPQYRDALLVNATLVNEAEVPTPFPVIELTLHDATGRIVGQRRFAPDEYLDHSIDAAAGMTPGQPVYVVLELGGDAARASSFEFSFL
ncbi:MAG: zinc-ribbon domain-containing protein [Gammaproteobacteria bacterium]|nr:zinc-ribbon domain-containing protein [Gammaproteobacteria bacterium]